MYGQKGVIFILQLDITNFDQSHRTFLGTLKEARILVSIVAVFIFCQSFTIVADAYEAFTCSFEDMSKSMCPSNPTIENIIDISHFLLTINSSINFALYVIHEKTFKEAIIKVTFLSFYKS